MINETLINIISRTLWYCLCIGQAGDGQEAEVEVKKEPKSSKSRGKAKGRAAVKKEETKGQRQNRRSKISAGRDRFPI